MLTDKACKTATCPAGVKRARRTDGAGLYLEISPAGSKRWFWKFYGAGKESRLALGSYPDVTLKAARVARDEARKTASAGTNPVQKRRAEKLAASHNAATTFEAVAREWLDMNRGTGYGWVKLLRFVFPWFRPSWGGPICTQCWAYCVGIGLTDSWHPRFAEAATAWQFERVQ